MQNATIASDIASPSQNVAFPADGFTPLPSAALTSNALPRARPTAGWRRVVKDLGWFFLVLAVLPSHNEWIICLGVVAVVAISFKIRYYPREWMLFALGSLMGLIFELGGDAIYKLQSWSEGSLFGIPAWLPLFWGLGFVFIRRFGNTVLLVRESA